jgi:hypothetical protein
MSAGVPLESIRVGERLDAGRTDRGIAELAESIRKYGLIQPIATDAERTLLDGGRRRAALELLAQQGHVVPVPIRVMATAKDEQFRLDIEFEANAHTEAWSLAAKHEYYRRRKARLEPEARERMAEGGRRKGGPAGPPLKKGRAEEDAAKAAGLSRTSARRLDEIKAAVDDNPDLAPLWDEVIKTGKINAVHKKVQRAQAAGGRLFDKDSWCTPEWPLAVVHAVAPNGISLDPCTNAVAIDLGFVRARHAWTIDDNALAQETWEVEPGQTVVWFQPPYGDPEALTRRLCDEWDRGHFVLVLALVRDDASTVWWGLLRDRGCALIIPRERIGHIVGLAEDGTPIAIDESNICSAIHVLARGSRAEKLELLRKLKAACGDKADVYPGAWALERDEPPQRASESVTVLEELGRALVHLHEALHLAQHPTEGVLGEVKGEPLDQAIGEAQRWTLKAQRLITYGQEEARVAERRAEAYRTRSRSLGRAGEQEPAPPAKRGAKPRRAKR